MNPSVPPVAGNAGWPLRVICCPNCHAGLKRGVVVECACCEFHSDDVKDLRIQQPVKRTLHFVVGAALSISEHLQQIDTTAPQRTYHGPRAVRDSAELMSEVSSRLPGGGAVLDLGCGPCDQAACLESLGFHYVGVDFESKAADFLADAHALPFADKSFDCVFSYAVFEHLHNPFIALQEVARVLKPGGWFIGTVSQGEPFHNSYFHHTAWGVLSIVSSVPELQVHRLWAALDTLLSLATMGRYSKLIRLGLRCLDLLNRRLPWLTPRKMRWPLKDRQLDRIFSAGSVCFAIEKNSTSDRGAI